MKCKLQNNLKDCPCTYEDVLEKGSAVNVLNIIEIKNSFLLVVSPKKQNVVMTDLSKDL